MTINKNVDIIRDENKDYLNVNSENRLIAQLVSASAENVYAFSVPFGGKVDSKTQKEMQGTYWLGVSAYDEKTYGDNVQIAVL